MKRSFCLLLAFGWTLAFPVNLAFSQQKAECLQCHGTIDILKMSEEERLSLVIPSEGKKEERPTKKVSLYVDEGRFDRSVHGSLECRDCHADISELPHPQRLKKVDCSSCHAEVAEAYQGSGHPAECYDCHNPHYARNYTLTQVAEKNDPCLRCHMWKEIKGIEAHKRHKGALGEKLSCTTCHSSQTKNGVLLHLVLKGKGQGEIDWSKGDKDGNGLLDFGELRSLLGEVKRRGYSPMLKPELVVLEPTHLISRPEAMECLHCHSKKTTALQTALLSVPSGETFPLEPKVLSTVSDFYPFGTDHLSFQDLEALFKEKETAKFELLVRQIGWKWLDLLGYLFLIGALLFVGLHGLLRLLTVNWRKRSPEPHKEEVL